ncbi:hypothetical protein JTB14_010741 [Gonioctena quinquepunctata]|nr:hypothetical protein JTB14_010741 [Gonioctena quinquepunctata]
MSKLEETINELSTDRNLKDKYIEKLKKEKEYIMEEAMEDKYIEKLKKEKEYTMEKDMRSEPEMNEIVNEQKNAIKEMETEMEILESKITKSEKTIHCTGTRTEYTLEQKTPLNLQLCFAIEWSSPGSRR